MAIRTQNGRVLTKNGRVSCACCSGISCSATDVMRNYWGQNLEYAIRVPITSEQRQNFLTNGATIQQVLSSSPFSMQATRSDGAQHNISGAVAPRTTNQTQPTPTCLIQRFYFGQWNINNTFKFAPYSDISYSFAQADWDGFILAGFVDSIPDHMLVGFSYWHFINDAGFPFFLQLILSGSTNELDRSQFGFGCSSFAPGAIESIWWSLLAPSQSLSPVPVGAGFSIAANVTFNGVSAPIQDTPIYYFVHKPSDGTFPSLDGNTYTSVAPQGTWTLNSLSAELNLAVTVNPIASAP